MCLREEENGTNWSQCCICVCEACLLHNLISYSYNSHSHAVISPGYHINKYIGSQYQYIYYKYFYSLGAVLIISDNYKVLYDLLQVSREERAAWEEHPECGAWPVIWEDKIRKS